MTAEVKLYAWPEGDETESTRTWFEEHQIMFEELDGTLAMSLVFAQEHSIFGGTVVSIQNGDDPPVVFGGYQPDRLYSLLSPSQ